MNLDIILNIMRKQVDIREIIAIGGMAQGNIQLQILADIFGMNVLKMASLEEATSMGAAVIAGVGIGALSGFDEAKIFNHVSEVVCPVKENTLKYNKIKPIFNSAYFALEDIFEQLASYKSI